MVQTKVTLPRAEILWRKAGAPRSLQRYPIDNGAGTAIAAVAARAGKSIAKLEEQFPAVEIGGEEPRTVPAMECASWNQAGKKD